MKTSTLLVLFLGTCFINGCVEPTPPPNVASPVGTWHLVKGVDLSKDSSRFKLITESNYVCFKLNNATRKARLIHGGSYSLTNNIFSEKIEYAGSDWSVLINQKADFKIRLEEDTLEISRGQYFREVWQRVPEGINSIVEAEDNDLSVAVKRGPVPAEVSSELSNLIDRYTSGIVVKERFISTEGHLVLKLEKSTVFTEGATITITSDNTNDLKGAVQSMNHAAAIVGNWISSGQRPNKMRGIYMSLEDGNQILFE